MPEPVENVDDRQDLNELIRFDKVTLQIGAHQLIDEISCTIGASGKIVVMGPNGAGKSLFLRLLSGLIKPTGGNIVFGTGFLDQDRNLDLSMVFQKPVLLRRSARANIAYVLKRKNLTREEMALKNTAALSEARLLKKAKISARQLSGGEQQRLALARALVTKPKLLLLDEVTANLDPASTHIVEGMIHKAAAAGTKVVLITHDVRQAKRMADEIIFIHLGKILAHKSATEFFHEPGNFEAQAYLDGRVPDLDLGDQQLFYDRMYSARRDVVK